jgi:hypothetical protein
LGAALFYSRLDVAGSEISSLEQRNQGWYLRGTALFAHDSGPARLEYGVDCDAQWRTRAAFISGEAAGHPVDRRIQARGGKWYLNEIEQPVVEGCVDIDLGFTPSTNTLPIRRLGLAIGESADVRAAWLPFPALEFQVLEQVYRREADHVYRYESAGGTFVRTLEVDGQGRVVRYPGIWESITAIG